MAEKESRTDTENNKTKNKNKTKKQKNKNQINPTESNNNNTSTTATATTTTANQDKPPTAAAATTTSSGDVSTSKSKKRKQREAFPYGNYRSYYGYRIGVNNEEDPRLKAFRREWFEGKDCLDIGCNSGIITVHLAYKFDCKSILGIDIDPDRINDAYWHLRKFLREEKAGKTNTNASGSKLTEQVIGSENKNHTSSVASNKLARDNSISEEKNLLDVVSFQKENFVLSIGHGEMKYDTIICLSVTKWVHLNWGDDGLITLFMKVWRLLRKGGIFILEPQPWKSYESNRLVSETTNMNYKNMQIGPENFQEILLDKIGFRTVEDVSSSLSASKTGFNRPILIFRK